MVVFDGAFVSSCIIVMISYGVRPFVLVSVHSIFFPFFLFLFVCLLLLFFINIFKVDFASEDASHHNFTQKETVYSQARYVYNYLRGYISMIFF